MRAALPPWVTAARTSPPLSDGGDRDCGGGNGDPNDTGGYGPGCCGAGNGNGKGKGNGNVAAGVEAPSPTGEIEPEAIDGSVGTDVIARLRFPSALATFLPLAPMPDNLFVEGHMVQET